MKTALIIAPFWRQSGHVGHHRIDRFVRWLAEDGCRVVLVRGGSIEAERQEAWGLEITVRDPLRLYRDPAEHGAPLPERKPNRLRRSLAYWIFNPDPGVVWARQVCAHPTVLQYAAEAGMILSSSPPESAHVAAGTLSRQLGVPHVMDLRDGWLDEPIKPLLRSSRLRRWLEGRLEHHLLENAATVLVTSEVWRTTLCRRMPALAPKVVVLTNGYPATAEPMESSVTRKSEIESRLELVHAGQFSNSDPSRVPDLLLQPLLIGIRQFAGRGIVRVIGSLNQSDRDRIKRFEAAYANAGWTIECREPMPRSELLDTLATSSGLLLLSASKAAIPSKLFEYIVALRPILAVTGRDSATWQICETLPSAFPVDLLDKAASESIAAFLSASTTRETKYHCPKEFSEPYLHEIARMTFRRFLIS